MIIAGAVLVLLSAASFVALILALVSMRDSAQLARQSANELAQAADVERLLIDMETGLRGFALTRDESYLAPWNNGRREFPVKARALAREEDNPSQRARMRAITRDGLAYINYYGVPQIQAIRRGSAGIEAGSALGALAISEQGRIRVDSLRRQLDQFSAFERATLDTRQRASDSDFRRAVVFASTSAALSLLLIALFTTYLARLVVRPVTRAAAMAGRVARGDLGTRVPETGVAEVGELERSFNSMAASVEASRLTQERLYNQQSALRRVAGLVAEEEAPLEIFMAVTREVGELLPADVAFFGRYEPDGQISALAIWERKGRTDGLAELLSGEEYGFFQRVRLSGKVARREGYDGMPAALAKELRSRSLRFGIACPIIVGGRVWGLLNAAATGDTSLSPDADSWLTDFAELAGTAIANARARSELSESRARVVDASDETRRRIERDLHDGAQQYLVQTIMELKSARRALAVGSDDVTSLLGQALENTERANAELRELARGIHPAVLTEGGLAPALATLARRSSIPVTLDLRIADRFPTPIEATVYYVVSEALTNAAKHSHASRVQVALEASDAAVRLTVRDDGVGGANPRGGTGLVGLNDRVEAARGRLTVESPAGEGTRLVVELPIDVASPSD